VREKEKDEKEIQILRFLSVFCGLFCEDFLVVCRNIALAVIT
jgi:hypothetical protein